MRLTELWNYSLARRLDMDIITKTDQSNPSAPQPSVFAVWRWKWWVWVVIVAMMPVCYFLSAPPVLVLAEWGIGAPYSDIDTALAIREFAGTFYGPAIYCSEHCELLEWVWEWEGFAAEVVIFNRPLSDVPRDYPGF